MATIIEVQTALQKLTNQKITYNDIGNILGTGRSNISLRAKNNSHINKKEQSLLEQAYNVSLDDEIKQILNNNTQDDNTIILDYYPDVCGSCGNGVFEFSTKKTLMSVPKESFMSNVSPSKQYFVINAYGNSMEPLIHNKDKLIIEKWNGEQIIDNSPYLFCYHDEIFIKRLVKNVDQLVIISENKDYDIRKLTGKEMNEVDIIGKVVGLLMREFE